MNLKVLSVSISLLIFCFACSGGKENDAEYIYDAVEAHGKVSGGDKIPQKHVPGESILEPEGQNEKRQLTTGEVIKKTFGTMRDLQAKENSKNNPLSAVIAGIKTLKIVFAEIDANSANGGKGLFTILKEIAKETIQDMKQIPEEISEEEALASAQAGTTKEIVLEPAKTGEILQ